jgi:hypothetical protein
MQIIRLDELQEAPCPMTEFNRPCRGTKCPCFREIDDECGYCGVGGKPKAIEEASKSSGCCHAAPATP